jgi:multiple sugar transport system substrate-binding protein
VSARVVVLGLVAAAAFACVSERGAPGRTRITFAYQAMWGDPAILREAVASVEREDPSIEIATAILPSASQALHQYIVTTLEARTAAFDVFPIDVVWVPELSRAGWIVDLSEAFPPAAVRAAMLPAVAEAVVVDGRTWAVPWFIDVGLLYSRSDLVPRAPRTFDELERFALDAKSRAPGVAGFVFTGRQYEGLVCVGYEAAWGFGAPGEAVAPDGRVLIDTPGARAGLGWLRRAVATGLAPPSVTSAGEEEVRHLFQSGRAVFMRNWPYAWVEAQAADSPVRGRVEIAPLPTTTGEPGHGALGGWQLALNAATPPARRAAALRLISRLTSLSANVDFAIAYGRLPPRRAAYDDARLRAEAPFIARLAPIVERARTRPVTPYYVMISDTLQGEFSSIVAGLRTPAAALEAAQRAADRLTGEAGRR